MLVTELIDRLRLRSPFVLGSGPPGRNAQVMIRHAATAGGIVTKSATWVAQRGSPQPRVARIGEYGLLNWEDLPNPGYAGMVEEIEQVQRRLGPYPVIGSIGPLESPEQQAEIARSFEAAGAVAIELDFKWGARVKGSLLGRITKAVRTVVGIPVIAKLAPFQGDIVEAAREVVDAGADAITAINSVFPAMRIDVRRREPVLSMGHGGLSGEPILPIAVSAVYRLYEAVRVPIFGSGGIVHGEDALQLVMAGAQALQVCTAVMHDGPPAFTRLNHELEQLLHELGFDCLDEAVGVAHRTPLYVPHSATAGGK